MKKIDNTYLMNKYIEKHNLENFFKGDIKNATHLMLFRKSEYICKQGENIDYVFIFVEGKAKVYNTLSNGKSLLICFYENLKIIGDLECLDPSGARSSIQVIEDTYCLAIPMKVAQEKLLNDAAFLRFMCRILGEKLHSFSRNSTINLLYPLENRVASYILATSEEKIIGEDERIKVFHDNLTEIAELLGTSYRHLLRTLNLLIHKGALKRVNREFVICKEEVLRVLAVDVYK